MRFAWIILGLTVFSIAACSSKDNSSPVLNSVKIAAKSIGKKKPDPEIQRAAVEGLTREQFIGLGKDPLILIDIEVSRQYATLNQISKNGDYDTFMSGDQKTITFAAGLMTSTRGMGADVMSLDNSSTRQALKSGIRGTVATQHKFKMLNSESHAVETVYQCALTDLGMETIVSIHKQMKLRHFQEICTGKAMNSVTYTNDYWMAAANQIVWKSRQWAGPVIGYLGVEVLIPAKNH